VINYDLVELLPDPFVALGLGGIILLGIVVYIFKINPDW
jgi:hypothetical protein